MNISNGCGVLAKSQMENQDEFFQRVINIFDRDSIYDSGTVNDSIGVMSSPLATSEPRTIPDHPIQMSFKFETPEQEIFRFRQATERLRNTTNRLAKYALLWKTLQDDIERNPAIQKQWEEFQLYRRLAGGSRDE
jgi:hypothetical protein